MRDISAVKKQARKDDVEFAIHNNRLEGYEASQEAYAIAKQWAEGLLSNEEFGRQIYEIHGLRSPY